MSNPEDEKSELELDKFKQGDDTDQSSEQNKDDSKLIAKSNLRDFIRGIVIFGVIDALFTFMGIYDDPYGFGLGLASIFIFVINLIGILCSIRHKYFMIGILTLMIYPFLLFGSCIYLNFNR